MTDEQNDRSKAGDFVTDTTPFEKRIILNRQQQRLYKALDHDARKELRLGEIYLGALLTLNDESNPVRIELAAHSIREILDKLPQTIDVPLPRKQAELAGRVRELEKTWDATLKSQCKSSSGWQGIIDPPLAEFLEHSNALFSWFKPENAQRHKEAVSAIRYFDPSPYRLPQSLEDARAKEWKQTYERFASLAHFAVASKAKVSVQEFKEQLGKIERFLLDMLEPRTFEDQDEIDRIIREGESHD